MSLQLENNKITKNTTPFLVEPKQPTEIFQIAKQEPPALSLDERGMIKDCNKSFERMVGFRRSELVWHHFSMVFPELKEVELFQNGQINPMLSYLSRCGQPYQTQNHLGESFPKKLNFVILDNQGKRTLRLIVRS
jgi:PAS domain S-box-containing protein